MKKFKYRYFWLSLIILFVAVWMPLTGKGGGPSFDKFAHFLLFFLVAVNVIFYFSKNYKQLIIVLLIVGTLPVITEIVQNHITGRSYDTKDIIADYLGLFSGIIFFLVFKKQCIAIYKFLGDKYIPNPDKNKS